MSLILDDFLITGRTYEEYTAFFDLDETSLIGKRVLDAPSGASSFVATANKRGIKAQGCDILYQFDIDAIHTRGKQSIEIIYQDTSWMQGNNFKFYGSIARHKTFRQEALELFVKDYNHIDYYFAELPSLPFSDDSFDLILSSHLLFVYDDRLDYEFHEATIVQMLRIAKEVRIFPLVNFQNPHADEEQNLSPFAYKIAERFKGEILRVDFEFQSGANYMMRIKR